jgi:hypothetical protein
MTPREASEKIETLMEIDKAIHKRLTVDEHMALIQAKQALDILATLEEGLHLLEPVTINRVPEWQASRGYRTHRGSDITDALGQLCTTLALEKTD